MENNHKIWQKALDKLSDGAKRLASKPRQDLKLQGGKKKTWKGAWLRNNAFEASV